MDEDEPSSHVRLHPMDDWVAMAAAMSGASHSLFTVTGRSPEEPDVVHGIDVMTDALALTHPGELPPLRIVRDVDSIIGYFQGPVPLRGDLHIIPVARADERLRNNVGISAAVQAADGTIVETPLHKIPNFQFGTSGAVKLRLHLPCLPPRDHQPADTPIPGTNVLKLIYDCATRPAGVIHAPDNVDIWPASYAQEAVRSIDSKGRQNHRESVVPAASTWAFQAEFLRLCYDDPQLKYTTGRAFFSVEVRGVKQNTRHEPGHENERRTGADKAASNLDLGNMDPEKSHIFADAALEIFLPGCMVQWRVDSHRGVLLNGLGNSVSQDQLNVILNRRELDLSAGLEEVGGFRADIKSNDVPEGAEDDLAAIKIVAYTTDKSFTALKDDGHHAKYLRIKDFVQPNSAGELSGVLKYMEKMTTVYESCKINTAAGHARYEVRIPWESVNDALTSLTDEFLRQSLIVFKAKTFWEFKMHRVRGHCFMLEQQRQASLNDRTSSAMLTLSLGLRLSINDLNARPEDYAPARRVRGKCFHPDPESAIHLPGKLFLVHEVEGPPYRLPEARQLSEEHLLSAMKPEYTSQSQYTAAFAPRRKVDGPEESHQRVPNRQVLVTTDHNIPQTDDDGNPEVSFNLEDINPIAHAQARRIWVDAPYQIIAKSPNENNSHSYLLDIDFAQSAAPNTTFKRPACHLNDIFRAFYIREGTAKDWRKNFDLWFPPRRDPIASKAQGYNTLAYRVAWKALLDGLSNEQVDILMARIRTEYNTQYRWFPAAKAGKAWSSGLRAWNVSFGSKGRKGPWFISNPAFAITREDFPLGDVEEGDAEPQSESSVATGTSEGDEGNTVGASGADSFPDPLLELNADADVEEDFNVDVGGLTLQGPDTGQESSESSQDLVRRAPRRTGTRRVESDAESASNPGLSNSSEESTGPKLAGSKKRAHKHRDQLGRKRVRRASLSAGAEDAGFSGGDNPEGMQADDEQEEWEEWGGITF